MSAEFYHVPENDRRVVVTAYKRLLEWLDLTTELMMVYQKVSLKLVAEGLVQKIEYHNGNISSRANCTYVEMNRLSEFKSATELEALGKHGREHFRDGCHRERLSV